MEKPEESRLVVTFENFPQVNVSKSKEAGRPIFDDLEVCRIRMSGDRLNSPVFPAHAEAPGFVEREDGTTEKVTYAQKFNRQYLDFKAGKAQTQEGTPLSELPFLTQAKRMELKALHIHTAESLAALDGQPLKALGQGGREWKNQAQAYLDNAAGSANVTKLAAETEFYKAEVERLRAELSQRPQPSAPVSDDGDGSPPAISEYEDWEDDLLKEFIAEKSGSKPRGNPSHSTLVKMAEELANEAA